MTSFFFVVYSPVSGRAVADVRWCVVIDDLTLQREGIGILHVQRGSGNKSVIATIIIMYILKLLLEIKEYKSFSDYTSE